MSRRRHSHLATFLLAIFLISYDRSRQPSRKPVENHAPAPTSLADPVSNSDVFSNLSLYDIGIEWCHFPPLKLLEPPSQELTGLVSFPGSGNSWLRYLIQQATGIATGSVYLDESLATLAGFPGEGIQNRSVIAVKTHQMPGKKDFDRVLILIRHPMDAIKAEFNRRAFGHIHHAPYSDFQSDKWKDFVKEQSEHWFNFNKAWLESNVHKLVLNYEDLVLNTFETLHNVLEFLDYPISDSDMWKCIKANKEGRLHRPQLPFEVYTYEMRFDLIDKYSKILAMIDK